jgi:hypothetical protein
MHLNSDVDEIRTYLDGRYLSPPESAWHVYEFRMHEEFPPVQRLALHEPNQQIIFFDDEDDDDAIRVRMDAATTTLMAFFEYNRRHEDGRGFLYADFPEHYVYDKEHRRWHPRQRGTAIGRMYQCNPGQGERFYVRLLLTTQRGPTGFDDLRTVAGVLHPTFRAACAALGLLRHDGDWWTALRETAAYASGRRVRTLFVYALVFAAVGDPAKLWDDFQGALSDDLSPTIRRFDRDLDTPEWRQDYARFLIHLELRQHGRSLADFHLPRYLRQWDMLDPDPAVRYADVPRHRSRDRRRPVPTAQPRAAPRLRPHRRRRSRCH